MKYYVHDLRKYIMNTEGKQFYSINECQQILYRKKL